VQSFSIIHSQAVIQHSKNLAQLTMRFENKASIAFHNKQKNVLQHPFTFEENGSDY
jgi:hypothetical protein